MAATYFGLDMAWSDTRGSGVCALDASGIVVDERHLATDGEIEEWIAGLATDRAVVAADIPLVVPNETGSRPCDRAVAAAYGSRRAGPHPANRALFETRFGRVRGEALRKRLEGLGFGTPFDRGRRTLFEVYPHPGLVEVFDLAERLRYKKGTVAERRRGLKRLRALLDRLAEATPPLTGPAVAIPNAATGRDLKAIEDRLDARFCAWAALLWAVAPSRLRVFGDATSGHILVPLG